MYTSIPVYPLFSSRFVLLEVAVVPVTVVPPPSPCVVGRVSSSLQAIGIVMLIKIQIHYERNPTDSFLLLDPYPLLILQQERVPGLLHVQVSSTHFVELCEGKSD